MIKKLSVLLLTLSLLLCGCADALPSATVPATTGGETLTVHYIDVGQADCALLECGGEFMLIDGGNVADSSLVVSYLQSCGVEELKTVVCTHAHEDHVGGLDGVMAVFPTQAVYAPTTTYASACYDKFLYYVDQQGLSVTIPSPGDTLTLGDASITVLGPVESYADTNNTSIVLQLLYGSTTFLFTGDMERDAENDMLDYWGDEIDWKTDVLKVGHHGSSTSSGYRFIYETDPDYAIISVGTGNSYGHPHDEVVQRYSDADVPMLRTDELGTITAVSDGQTVTLTWEKQQNEPSDVPSATSEYIGNRNSKKFHTSTCSSLPKEENRTYFDSYQDALDAGYTPCGNCLG